MKIEVVEIDNWSNKIEARDTLPLLVRKLIKYDLSELIFSYMPVKSRVGMHGPDGVIKTNFGTQYVPKGTSLWEMGVGKEPIKKANFDINKRTKNPPYDINPSETTYIQVTSRACDYEDLTGWHEKQKNKKNWKNVRIYDAHTLEEWIESAPPVEKWFANILNIPINGVERLEDWWNDWRITDEFDIQPSLVLIDKEYESSILIKHLAGLEDINVRASNMDKALAFLYSVISQLDDKDKFLERCLVIDNEEALEHYLSKKHLILIPTFDYKNPNNSKNMIYKPLLYSDPSKEIIELKDPRKKYFEDELKNMGISPQFARRYARDSGRDMSILKRLASSNIKSPEWVNDEYRSVLITLTFIESWNESVMGDLNIIENLSGMDYASFSRKCYNLLNEIDSPIIKIENVWILKSPKDLLYLSSRYVADSDLEKFKNAILNVFNSSKEHTSSSIARGLENYSDFILRGILKSLILLSVYGDDFNTGSVNLKSYVDGIVYELSQNSFIFLNLNCQYLKFFAEASPNVFVDAVKKIINEEPSVINSLFPINNYTTRYVYLLWALEHIAWSQLLFRDITVILVELCKIEYDSMMHNSPFETLKDLFVPNYVNTYVSLDMRLNMLNNILKNELDVGWKLLTNLLSDRCSAMVHSEAYWRYPKNRSEVEGEVEQYHLTLEDYLLEYSGFDSKKWVDIFEYYRGCSEEFRNEILIKFDEIKHDLDNIYLICEELRDIISWYNEFYNGDDLEEIIAPLEEIYSFLEPDDLIEKNSWAFNSHYASTLTGRYYDNDDDFKKIRRDTVNHILSENGFEGIKNFIKIVECPDIIANCIYKDDWDDEIIPLINDDEKCRLFSTQYIFLKTRFDENWLSQFIQKFDEDEKDIIITVLTSATSNRKTWDVVETFDQDIQDKYWIQTPNNYHGTDRLDLEFYISKLFEYEKYDLLIEYLNMRMKSLSLEYIADMLFQINVYDKTRHNDHLIVRLLDFLHEKEYPKDDLMNLELKYGNCFRFEKSNYNLIIHEEFSKNPIKFCEIVEKRFDRTLGWDNPYVAILGVWKIIPGIDETNHIDEEYLFDWIEKCGSLLDGENLDYSYYKIGFLLGCSEKNADNLPCEEISKIIEDFQDNEYVNLGFKRGLNSKRTGSGVVYKEGNFESLIAEKYRMFCQNNLEKYPITSKLVYSLSKQFEEQAKRDENELLLREWIYD